MTSTNTPEHVRLQQDVAQQQPWKKWGPYLAERQWGTVREDYSHDGDCWNSFSHDHARSRAYRWGEDGLLGMCDDQCRLCFALAFWNGKDPILKERLFGLTGPEGNHGEDVKEHYFYLDATPTHSLMRASYKYPINAFPYARLAEENRGRSRDERELEVSDTDAFDAGHWNIEAQYAKASADDIVIRVVITNHSDHSRDLHALPTLWFRNQWSWGNNSDDHVATKPRLHATSETSVHASHPTLGEYELLVDEASDGTTPELIFTENESNTARLWGTESHGHTKDAFHELVVSGHRAAVNPMLEGTKAAAWFQLRVPAHGRVVLRLRLRATTCACGHELSKELAEIDTVQDSRQREADQFYAALGHNALSKEHALIARQAAAGLLWSKQFYNYDVKEWLGGDAKQPQPPDARKQGRNAEWQHLNNRDILLMPDKWEYPWYAAWDLAFHCVAVAKIDPHLAKEQLVLMLREWYMHPSGQIPAYEFAFGDVNPPVHAWAVWRVYKMTGERGKRDRTFLARCFQKLLINFTWWVNRKDPAGKNLFAGGFLGLDNIGVFDRSRPLPTGGHLEQADGTAWMAFYCGTMLSIALELAREDAAYEDIATKFFEHFIAITDAINSMGGKGLWDEQDGFYYDQVALDGATIPLRVRSLVGIVPLLAVEVLESDTIDKLPDFKRRMEWFLERRKDLPWHATCSCGHSGTSHAQRLLAIPSKDQLRRVTQYLMNEQEFLSPFGVRSVSRFHERNPFVLRIGGEEHRVDYTPGESTTSLFGGNSNWRGPIWLPLNFLIIEALERYHHFYGDSITIENAASAGSAITLKQSADEIRRRLVSLMLPDAHGARACHGSDHRFATDPAWSDLLYFYEHFHADTGRGLGASHQTGWTALLGLLVGGSEHQQSDAHTHPRAAVPAHNVIEGKSQDTTAKRRSKRQPV
ncbi:MAG: glucosidase [Phycisphaerales bacterium]